MSGSWTPLFAPFEGTPISNCAVSGGIEGVGSSAKANLNSGPSTLFKAI